LEKALSIIEERGNVHKIIVNGDCFSIGGDPKRTLDLLMDLPNAIFVRGNHDRYLIEKIWDYDRPTVEGMDPDDPVCIDIVANQKWTAEQIGSEGQDFIRQMKISHIEKIDKCFVEFTHAWFTRDDIPPTLEEAHQWRNQAQKKYPEFRNFALVHGHTHLPRFAQYGNLKVACPGATGMPFDENQKGAMGFITIGDGNIEWEQIRFDYDINESIATLERNHPPFFKNLISTIKHASIRND
jgi:predicted phosphodiesterase